MDAAAPPSVTNSHLRTLADDVFDRTSPYEGYGFRHHCQRLHRFATMLMDKRDVSMPDDVSYAVAMWHDLGIVSKQDEGHNYLQRSRALFHRETEGLELDGVDSKVLDECFLYNHRALKVPGLSPQADCFRNAVMIEHARGHIRFGLDRAKVKQAFRDLPRGNFDSVLLDFTRRTLRREPLTLVRGIFF